MKLRLIIVAKSVFENAEQCKRPDIKHFYGAEKLTKNHLEEMKSAKFSISAIDMAVFEKNEAGNSWKKQSWPTNVPSS